MRHLGRLLRGLVVSGVLVSSGMAEEDATRVVDRLLGSPKVQAEAGFTAKLLVPPGQLYDPLFLLPREQTVWLNDDGGEEHDKGSRLLAIDQAGTSQSSPAWESSCRPWGLISLRPVSAS